MQLTDGSCLMHLRPSSVQVQQADAP